MERTKRVAVRVSNREVMEWLERTRMQRACWAVPAGVRGDQAGLLIMAEFMFPSPPREADLVEAALGLVRDRYRHLHGPFEVVPIFDSQGPGYTVTACLVEPDRQVGPDVWTGCLPDPVREALADTTTIRDTAPASWPLAYAVTKGFELALRHLGTDLVPDQLALCWQEYEHMAHTLRPPFYEETLLAYVRRLVAPHPIRITLTDEVQPGRAVMWASSRPSRPIVIELDAAGRQACSVRILPDQIRLVVRMAKSDHRRGSAMQDYHYVWLSTHPDRSEEWLKKQLAEGFHVHHIDWDHSNNHPKNLILIEGADHMRLHGMSNFRIRTSKPTQCKIKTKTSKTKKPNKKTLYIGMCAYEMRRNSKLISWSDIDVQMYEQFKCGRGRAAVAAKLYAKYEGLPWPLRNKKRINT